MEVKINREIRNYKENIFFGLSIRQFIFSLLSCLSAVFLYFLLRNKVNTEVLSWICMLGAIPFVVLGFVTYNGMTIEKFIFALIKSELLIPRNLKFSSEDIYYLALKDWLNKRKKEDFKK